MAQTIIDLLGSEDNLNEPRPSWNQPTTILSVVITFLVLLIACVSFRAYTRLRIIYSPGWDDLFVVIVAIWSVIGSVSICIASRYGMGQHFILLPYATEMQYLRFFYIANASYVMATACVKVSLLLQYLRIYTAVESPRMRRLCLGLLAFIGAWGAAYSFLAWFPCFPVRRYWSWKVPGRCFGMGALYADEFFSTFVSHTAMNMVLDVVVLAVPVPIYFRKDTPRQMRLGLLGLLCMGGCVNFISIWRLATIVEHRATTSPTFDPTWYAPISIILATLEVDVAGICASVPVFWPVLTAKVERIFVTQEIKIEHSHRFSCIDEEEGIELSRHACGGGDASLASSLGRAESVGTTGAGVCSCEFGGKGADGGRLVHSRTKSAETLRYLHMVSSAGSQPVDAAAAHYGDSYVVSQVDPLAPPQHRSVGAETTTHAVIVPGKTSRF